LGTEQNKYLVNTQLRVEYFTDQKAERGRCTPACCLVIRAVSS